MPPAWLSEMSTFTSSEIDTFLTMFANADRTPILIASDTLQNILIPVGVNNIYNDEKISVSPNPTANGLVTVTTGVQIIGSIDVYNQHGSRVAVNFKKSGNVWQVELPQVKGVYLLVIKTSKGKWIKKVLYI